MESILEDYVSIGWYSHILHILHTVTVMKIIKRDQKILLKKHFNI